MKAFGLSMLPAIVAGLFSAATAAPTPLGDNFGNLIREGAGVETDALSDITNSLSNLEVKSLRRPAQEYDEAPLAPRYSTGDAERAQRYWDELSIKRSREQEQESTGRNTRARQ